MKSQQRGTLITGVPILGQLFARLLSQRLFGNWQGLKTCGLLLLTGLMFTISPVNAAMKDIQVNAAMKDIQGGSLHTCVLTTAGDVKCWGMNGYGQLGDGSTTDSAYPVAVSGLNSDVSAIATGSGYTCALMTTGGVKCWGTNHGGQLGNGSTTPYPNVNPVTVLGLSSGVRAIALGFNHSCALMTTGGVKCWGGNRKGQLGDGSTKSSPQPVDVFGLSSGVRAIALGFNYSCALMTTGGIKCWGVNSTSQLGDGSTTNQVRPVAVSALSSGVSAIALGHGFSCVLTMTGGVKCWGGNSSVLPGDGTSSVDILDSGASAIDLGNSHACALMTTGNVKCWGRNVKGQLGDGSTKSGQQLVDVLDLSGVSAIGLGEEHSCALMTTGGAKCWGSNDFDKLGDGSAAHQNIPVDVKFGNNEEASVTPEPSTHPAGFGATAGPTSMTLNWKDSVDASGYLIMCNVAESFTAPVDGTAQTDDTYCSDGGVKNVAQGVGTYTWTDLNPETQYYFRVYPYSNKMGPNIDYKTDGTVPNTKSTTLFP